MKRSLVVALSLAVSVALPQVRGADSPLEPKTKSEAERSGAGMELDANYGFAAGSKSHTGGTDLGHVSVQNADVRFVVSPELGKDFFLRAGFEWERFSFGLNGAAPLPSTLQQISGVFGFDCQIDEHWLLRMEVQPGIYSDFKDITSRDVDAPVILGASYLVDSNLQWVLGLHLDPRSRYWIAPAAGVRWKFADEWTLNMILPTPRLEYDLNKQCQLYFGGRLLSGTFRLADDFGNTHPVLTARANNTMLDFFEVRVGPGVVWKLLPNLTLEAETGCMVYREFEFDNPHLYIRSNRPAPYGQLSLHTSF